MHNPNRNHSILRREACCLFQNYSPLTDYLSIFTRVVIFYLRAVQAKSDSSRFSGGLVTYQQISFGMGFIGIASDAVRLVKCLFVNATYGPEKYSESPAAATKGGLVPPPTADTPDQPQARSWYRKATGLLGLAFLGSVVPGVIANSNYSSVLNSQTNADLTSNTRLVVIIIIEFDPKPTIYISRIASTAVAVALSCIVVYMTLWGPLKLPRISKRGVAIIGAIYSLIVGSAQILLVFQLLFTMSFHSL